MGALNLESQTETDTLRYDFSEPNQAQAFPDRKRSGFKGSRFSLEANQPLNLLTLNP
jgi:hypothetical protein